MRKIDAFTALMAIFTFVVICATWIDAFYARDETTLDFGGLWAPILVATCYYLAATVVFPTDEEEFHRLADYSRERKRFVVAMFLAAETFLTIMYFDDYVRAFTHRPATLWLVMVPAYLIVNGLYVALLVVRARRANIAILSALVVVFVTIYWSGGWVYDIADQRFGYLWAR